MADKRPFHQLIVEDLEVHTQKLNHLGRYDECSLGDTEIIEQNLILLKNARMSASDALWVIEALQRSSFQERLDQRHWVRLSRLAGEVMMDLRSRDPYDPFDPRRDEPSSPRLELALAEDSREITSE